MKDLKKNITNTIRKYLNEQIDDFTNITLYHGTNDNFDEFDIEKSGLIHYSDWGKGIYFTRSKSLAHEYRIDAVKKLNKEYNDAYEEYVKTQRKFRDSKHGTQEHKDLLPIILKDRTEEQYYVEPFVGGCNIIEKVKGKRIASDSNKYLIALWKGLQQGRELIMEIPKELYDQARNQYNERENHNFDDFTIGWIGFMASFNGRFYGGGYSGKHKNRDYVDEQIRNTLKQVEAIKDIDFHNCNYDQLQIPKGSIVYCDIPYQGTKEYDTKDKFNHDKFWQWCREVSKENTVFVSEYNAPSDFECVWQKEVNVSIRPNKTLAQVEKLFKFSQTIVQ